MSRIQHFKQLVFARSWGEVLGRAFELTFGYILYAISFLTPRKQKRWVFGTNVGFADNAKYLYIATLAHRDIDACWIAGSRSEAEAIANRGMNSAYKYSLKGLRYCLTAKYYVFTYHSKDINFFTSGRAKKINLWHGVGIKKGSKTVSKSMPAWVAHILLPHLFERIDLFLSTSPLMNRHFQHMFELPDGIIYEGMYPRCAFLMQPSEQIELQVQHTENAQTIETIQTLKRYNHVYIYMPTWRINMKDTFLTAAGIDFEQVDRLMSEQNSLFVVKLHPAVKMAHKQGTYKHILFLDKSQDIYPILPFTQTLITDYSSIYYDYLLMEGKRVILFPFDIEDYRAHADELAFDYDEYTPGKRVYTFDELTEELSKQAVNGNVDKREWVLQQFWGDYKAKADVNQLIEKIQSL